MSNDLATMWAKGLASGTLAFPRCTACGAWNWYPLPRCGCCQSDQIVWREVTPLGSIFIWTRSHHDFVKGGTLAEPAVIALVEMADAPNIRIPCRQGTAGAPPRIGEGVRLEVGRLNGVAVWCYVPQGGVGVLAAEIGAP